MNVRSQEHTSIVTTAEHLGFPSVWFLDGLREQSPVSYLFPDRSLICVFVLFGKRSTSITISHKSRAGNPSIRNAASNEMISDSVELWDADVCFLHIQLMGQMYDFQIYMKNSPEVDFKSSRSPAKSESWNSPNLHCFAVLPTWQYWW